MADTSRPTVFITGCSSGLGLGLAVELGRRNWRVIASMRDVGRREQLDRKWAEAGLDPSELRVLALDVTSADSVEAATRETAVLTGGAPDLLILNAGLGMMGFFEDFRFRTFGGSSTRICLAPLTSRTPSSGQCGSVAPDESSLSAATP